MVCLPVISLLNSAPVLSLILPPSSLIGTRGYVTHQKPGGVRTQERGKRRLRAAPQKRKREKRKKKTHVVNYVKNQPREREREREREENRGEMRRRRRKLLGYFLSSPSSAFN